MKTRKLLIWFGGIVFICALISLSGCKAPYPRLKAEQLTKIDGVVQAQIAEGNIPGAVVCVGQGKDIVYLKAFGYEVIEPYKEEMTLDTIFDLASLTKPIGTATSILILVDQGKICLDDRVGKYLPEFAVNGKEDVRIHHLLTHTSGLPPYTNAAIIKKESGAPCPDKVIEKICSLEAQSALGDKFTYSCLGYITLGRIVKIVSGVEVDEFATKNIFKPLGMKHTGYNPPEKYKPDIAATEISDGKLLRGFVHDPLAQLMDGVSGNAGLFSTAEDMAIYCQMLLNNGKHGWKRILSKKSVELLTTPQSKTRSYGFDIASSYSWIKGQYGPGRAFCHSGYTGTSLVCDPASKVYLIILTNRAHPHDKGASKPTRVGIADIVFGSIKEAH